MLVRASGTEPLLRIYCEAASPELVSQILRETEVVRARRLTNDTDSAQAFARSCTLGGVVSGILLTPEYKLRALQRAPRVSRAAFDC